MKNNKNSKNSKNSKNNKKYSLIFVLFAFVCLIAVAGSGCLGSENETDDKNNGTNTDRFEESGWAFFDHTIRNNSGFDANSYHREGGTVTVYPNNEAMFVFQAYITYSKNFEGQTGVGYMVLIEDGNPMIVQTSTDGVSHIILFYTQYANDYERWKKGELAQKPNFADYENEALMMN